jgi:tetratricopeptide (TPR) repeat protein
MIPVQCLHCHCNQADHVADTVNRYRPPLFQGFAIGCERCHGPGELHVKRHQEGDLPFGLDETIVNPRNLSPDLRDAVCQQCHLQGETRILSRGREPFDYRPGLPLHLFWSTFFRNARFIDNQKPVNHVQQLSTSRCAQKSDGKLGCISCHDPHALPAASEKATYFRSRCLQCHQETSCSIALAVRSRTSREDNCTTCHMPRFEISTISHTANTDHRILRFGKTGLQQPTLRDSQPADENPIFNYHRNLLDPMDKDAARDLGVAYVELGRQSKFAESFAPQAITLLDKAVQEWPDDLPALEARACALWFLGRPKAAAEAYEAVLARSPEREVALAEMAQLASALHNHEAAIGYWQRVVAVNPWYSRYHYQLALVLAERQRWKEAVQACKTALRLNPANQETRYLLIGCLIRLGDKDQARTEFATLGALNPEEKETLQRWFDEQLR